MHIYTYSYMIYVFFFLTSIQVPSHRPLYVPSLCLSRPNSGLDMAMIADVFGTLHNGRPISKGETEVASPAVNSAVHLLHLAQGPCCKTKSLIPSL